MIAGTGDPISPGDIERLCRAAQHAGITVVEWTDGNASLRLRLGPVDNAPHPVEAGAACAEPRGIHAPTVGFFRHHHPTTGRAISRDGERVHVGQVVGYLQAGAMLHPVVATEPGIVGAPLHDDGAAVGYGTLLYRLT